MSHARLFAYLFGAIYLVVGIVGLVSPGGLGMNTTHLIGLFPVNIIHNLVHLGVGGIGLALGATGVAASRFYARLLAVVYGLVAVLGFAPQPFLSILPLGSLDIVLHTATAVIALYIGFLMPQEAGKRA